MSYNPNCGRCGMLNHWGQCQLTACRYPVQESGVINGSAYVAKIVTNADRIRAMSDEELAEFINNTEYGFIDSPGMCDVCDNHRINKCLLCWLDWLKSPVEEDNG